MFSYLNPYHQTEGVLIKNFDLIKNFKEKKYNLSSFHMFSVGANLRFSDHSLKNYSLGNITLTNHFDYTISLIKNAGQAHFDQMIKSINEIQDSYFDGRLVAVIEKVRDFQKFNNSINIIKEIYRHRISKTNENMSILNEFNELEKLTDEFKNNEKMIMAMLTEKIEGAKSQNLLNSMIKETFITPEIFVKKKNIPNSSITKYQEEYASNLNLEQISSLIDSGRELCGKILSGEKTTLNENYEEANLEISQLTWFLMNCAIEKGDGFFEGSFIIEDKDDRIFNFLMSTSFSKARKSSHLKGRILESQYGLDCFNGLMPAFKRTLLFGRFNNEENEKLLFLKPENYSADPLNAYDAVMHTYEFVLAQYNKKMYPGSDDLSSMRKERIPVNVIKTFQPIGDFLKIEQYETNVKLRGIEYMYKVAKQERNKFSHDEEYTFNALLQFLNLVEFLKEYEENYTLENDENKNLVKLLINNDNPLNLILTEKLNLKEVIDRLLGIEILKEVNNPKLNRLLAKFQELQENFNPNFLNAIPQNEKENFFIDLIKFYQTLEGMDHLDKRIGKEAFFDFNELVSYVM